MSLRLASFLIATQTFSVVAPAAPPAKASVAELRKEVALRNEADSAVQAADRKEFVRPAPNGYKAKAAGRKLELRLLLRDAVLPRGGSLWYAVELVNAGSESLQIWELDSFLKHPLADSSFHWTFLLTPPEGKERELPIGDWIRQQELGHRRTRPVDIPGSERMSTNEVTEFIRRAGQRKASERNLRVQLEPGETLSNRPWRWVPTAEYDRRFDAGEAELWPKPEGRYSELLTRFKWDTPGTYRLRVRIDADAPGATATAARLGRIESETVEFQVAR